MGTTKRNPINIRFRFNKESGEIEDLIVDDNTPNASDNYHDKIARIIGSQLGVRPVIEDAGAIRFETRTVGRTEKEKPGETNGPGKMRD